LRLAGRYEMRLSKIEQQALEEALKGVRGEVYLFGSRVDDVLKGGDIDILIFSDENPLHLSQRVTLAFMKKCEERIDVIVFNPQDLSDEQQAFLAVIEKERIR
jgi:predicted nucleotidyltransferase